MGHKVELVNVRLSYPHLDEPTAYTSDGKKKYQATFILDPSDDFDAEQIKEVKRAAFRARQDKFGDKSNFPRIKNNFKCFGMGEDMDTCQPGWEGKFIVKSKREEKDGPPLCMDQRSRIVKIPQTVFYGGCYVQATMDIYVWEHREKGRGPSYGINAGLRAIRFLAEGEAFGRSREIDPDSEFEHDVSSIVDKGEDKDEESDYLDD